MKKLKRGLLQGVAIVGVLVAPIAGTITQVYAANEGDPTAQETTSESFSEASAASSQEASTEVQSQARQLSLHQRLPLRQKQRQVLARLRLRPVRPRPHKIHLLNRRKNLLKNQT